MQIGDLFGRLEVVGNPFKPYTGDYTYYVECKCSCGSESRLYRKSSLTKKTNPTKSCGCLQKEKASEVKTSPSVGQRFSRLVVVGDSGVREGRRWLIYKCDCGNSPVEYRKDLVEAGHTKSCGCLYEETRGIQTHGMVGTREYKSWQSMKDRCNNVNSSGYENYGGRGITYDHRWEKFENFFADMGYRPSDCELDRIDVDGNYCKENCRWIDSTFQSHNRRKIQNTSSQYTGVYYDKVKTSGCRAYITTAI